MLNPPEAGENKLPRLCERKRQKNEKFDSERLPPLEEDFWFSDMILFDFT